MDTIDLLINNHSDSPVWLIFGLSMGCLFGSIIGLGVVRLFESNPTWPLVILLVSMFAVPISGWVGIQHLQDDAHRIDAETVTAALHDDYGVEHIKTGTPEAGDHIDMDDPSKNTYDAAEMTVGDTTYKDCQATFGPTTEHDHKTYRSMQVTCQSTDEQRPGRDLEASQVDREGKHHHGHR